MNKEPFLQVSKRRNKAGWQERLLIRFIALILALIVCGAVIVALVKMNPVVMFSTGVDFIHSFIALASRYTGASRGSPPSG